MIDQKADNARWRAQAYAAVTFNAHARKPVKNKLVKDVQELGLTVSVYLGAGRDAVDFYAPLPDGREVVGASFDAVKLAIIWCIRDGADVVWSPVIKVKALRVGDRFSGTRSSVRPDEAKEILTSGAELPVWVGAGIGIELDRFYLAQRLDGTWVELRWDHGGKDKAPWECLRWASQYYGPKPADGVDVSKKAPELRGYSTDHEDTILVPFTKERWAELKDLESKLKLLHVHVAALFADDGSGRKLMAGRLIDGIPILKSGLLLGGPTTSSEDP